MNAAMERFESCFFCDNFGAGLSVWSAENHTHFSHIRYLQAFKPISNN